MQKKAALFWRKEGRGSIPGVEDFGRPGFGERRKPPTTRLDGGRLKGSEGPSDAGYIKPVDGTEEDPFNKVHYRLRKINTALMKEILLLKCCKGPRRIFCAGAQSNG